MHCEQFNFSEFVDLFLIIVCRRVVLYYCLTIYLYTSYTATSYRNTFIYFLLSSLVLYVRIKLYELTLCGFHIMLSFTCNGFVRVEYSMYLHVYVTGLLWIKGESVCKEDN